jgi:hypothetical protein
MGKNHDGRALTRAAAAQVSRTLRARDSLMRERRSVRIRRSFWILFFSSSCAGTSARERRESCWPRGVRDDRVPATRARVPAA